MKRRARVKKIIFAGDDLTRSDLISLAGIG
jgi:hypothetical protein